ncbi:anti-sigma factor family protein [Streptomyces sp. enrichment culture]|uniref:anti-sigma factor family protein n=1 Tax=Streptomyces sp. enrichment culture TaxID=1795815 RepID=UPI003F551FC2
MSGSWPKPGEEYLAEHHLGDRLAALVDGELGHDTRERVLAHVATCPKCKAEVDAQRRLKNVFAEAAPPPPSESLLARLQGLPAGGDLDGGGTPSVGGGLSGGLGGRPAGVFGMRRGERFEFDYVPAGSHAVLPSEPAPGRGFRIHDVGRSDADRSASRGRRFAFVAAGAVSLAAIALGGVTTGMPADTTEARGGSGGTNVTPARTGGGSGTATPPDSQRRRGSGPLLVQGQGGRQSVEGTAVAPTQVSAPLFPGAAGADERPPQHAVTTPVVAGVAAVSPLIRPLPTSSPFSLSAWSASPGPFSQPPLAPSATPSVSQEP